MAATTNFSTSLSTKSTTPANTTSTTTLVYEESHKFACYYFNSDSGHVLFHISDKYNGIPSILAFNLILTLFILISFFLVWNYLERIGGQDEGKLPFESLRQAIANICGCSTTNKLKNSNTSSTESIRLFGTSWFFMVYEDMVKVYGEDTLTYLYFQRYMMFFSLVISACAVIVFIPINVLNGKDRNINDYTAATFANLPARLRFVTGADIVFILVHALVYVGDETLYKYRGS